MFSLNFPSISENKTISDCVILKSPTEIHGDSSER